MNKKSFAGVALIILSALIALSSTRFTGAVIGSSNFNYLSIASLALFIAGVGLLAQSSGGLVDKIAEEGIILPPGAVQRLNSISPNEKKTLVLDTSYIRAYTAEGIKDVISSLENYDLVLAPKRVIGELRSQERDDPSLTPLREYIETLKNPEEGFEPYRKPARSYLEKGRKNLFFEKIVPILLGKEKAPTTRREAVPLKKECAKVLGYLRKDNLSLTEENLSKVFKRNYKVSATDVDVLATSLAEIKYTDKPVVIAGKDVDFEDAVGQVWAKPKRKVNWKHLKYSTPYETEAA